MKRLLLIFILLMSISNVMAQDDFEPFENPQFGMTGLVPMGWNSAGFGAYARGESATDVTQVVIQSAPLSRDALIETLLPRLGQDSLPEASGQIQGENLIWEDYEIAVEAGGMSIGVSLALTEADGIIYLVILQSLADEHGELRENVYIPVVESIELLNAAEPEVVEEEVAYISEDVTFTSGDVTLAGTLTLPNAEGQHPAVVLIAGSGPSDRNVSLAPFAEIEPFAIIADHLTRNGIAVLRYDDRGFGESQGDFGSTTMSQFATDASAAVNYLVSRDDINAAQIGILGYGEGGAIAPEVVITNDNVAFVVGLAAPVVGMFDILREQNRQIFTASGFTEEQVEAVVTAFDAMRAAMEADDDTALRVAIVGLVEAQSGQTPDDAFIEQVFAQLESFKTLGYVDYDVTGNWAQVDVPVLAIYGALDTQVPADQNIPVLETELAENVDLTIVTIEGANHLFQEAETGSPNEYPTLEQTMMPDMLDELTAWLLEHVDVVE
jgi:pimeloyl-ACP methyl ester carboxylesterase